MDMQRRLLYEMNGAIMRLNQAIPGSKDITQLVGVHHNLQRMWSDT